MRGSAKTNQGQSLYYYVDANRLDRELNCPQGMIRAERIEAQVVKWLRSQIAECLTAQNREIDGEIRESEVRFDRAKDL